MAKKLSKINLICYVIRFRKKGDSIGNYIKFSELFPKGFIDFSQRFISSIDLETYQNSDGELILDIEHTDHSFLNRNILTGIFEKGTKAKSGAAIKEIKRKKAVTVKKIKGHEYTTIPYYFLLGATNNVETKGCVFMAQTFGVYGFKEIFTETFQSFVRKEFDDEISCDINTLSNPTLFENVIKTSSVRKLKYRKHSLPPILDEAIGDEIENNIDRSFFDIELSISAKKEGYGFMRNALNKMVKGDHAFLELFDNSDFTFDEVYADMYIGGNKRVVNVTKPSNFGAIYDVGDNIKYDEEGIPKFESIRDMSLDIYENDILKNVDLTK